MADAQNMDRCAISVANYYRAKNRKRHSEYFERWRRMAGYADYEEARGAMLRISVEENPGAVSLIVEGRLVGPWVDELQRLCDERGAPGKHLQTTVDLCGVTAMDTRGQALLDNLFRRGATIRCSDVMNQFLVEQIVRPAEQFQEPCRPCHGIDQEGGMASWPGSEFAATFSGDKTRLGVESATSYEPTKGRKRSANRDRF